MLVWAVNKNPPKKGAELLHSAPFFTPLSINQNQIFNGKKEAY